MQRLATGGDRQGPAAPRWPAAIPGTRFFEVRHLDTVGSTNAEVLSAAAGGTPEGLVVVADHQQAGRGRLGRSWEAPPGANLLVSILLRPALSWDDLHCCATAVALAAATASATLGGVAVGCKWPNDLVVGGKKLAGVLAEAVGGPSGPDAVVVGLGLNVGWPGPGDRLVDEGTSDSGLPENPEVSTGPAAPVGSVAATSLLTETGRQVSRPALLSALLVDLHTRLLDVATVAGRRRQAAEYRRRCVTIGQEVQVSLPNGTLHGVAGDVTDAGALVVTDGAADHLVSVGDVVHVRTRPMPGHGDR